MFQISFRSLQRGTRTGVGPGPDSVSVYHPQAARSSNMRETGCQLKTSSGSSSVDDSVSRSSRPHCFTSVIKWQKLAESPDEPR